MLTRNDVLLLSTNTIAVKTPRPAATNDVTTSGKSDSTIVIRFSSLTCIPDKRMVYSDRLRSRMPPIVDKPFLRLDEPSDISGRLIFYVSELFVLAEGGTDTSGMVAKYRDEFIPPILDDLSAFLEDNNDQVDPKTERFARVAYSDLLKLHSAHPNNRCIAEALSIYKQLPIVNQV